LNVAVVARVDLRQAIVLDSAGTEFACRLRARFMDRAKRLRGALVAGDEVEWDVDEGTAVIEEVLPRRNAFSRRASGHPPREQVVAANLDQVLLVAALIQPPLRSGLIDRVAVAAEAAGVPLRIVLSKVDLVDEESTRAPAARYREVGYPVHLVSVPAGRGVSEVHHELAGRRTLVVGHSGVGKSTLLNAIQPSLGLRIGAVNPVTGRGRQTTAAGLLCRLADGTEIVDTPGFRAFAPWGVPADELILGFREFAAAPSRCRFSNCGHREEPGCAVRELVERGAASRDRYESFLRLREEIEQEVEA
jgi:ribosome biogenesis GTPase